MALNAGTAFVAVKPDMRGFIKGVKGPALAAGAGIATAVVAGMAGLTAAGKVFEDVRNTIVVGTGASGKALKGLEADARAVGKNTPSAFKDIGGAVADLNTRLGLTGKPLQSMASQMLNLSRITKTDVSQNIADVTRVFGDWSIKTKDQSAALDKIFYTSQATGVGLDKLAQSVVQFGAPLRQFGFSFEQSLAMFGKWEKEGVNTQAVMSGLKIGLGKLSKAGKDPVKAFAQVQNAIKNAGSAGEANKIAIETFGQRAGPDMAAAVREGRFELSSLVKGLKGSKGSIADADKRTRTMSESWQLFKNRVLIAVRPLAVKFLDVLTRGFKALTERGIPAVKNLIKPMRPLGDVIERVAGGIKSVGQWMNKNRAVVATFAGVILTVATGIKIATAATALWNAVLAINPFALIVIAIAAFAAALVLAYKKSATFRKIVQGAWSGIKTAVSWAWNYAIKPALVGFSTILHKVLIPVIKFLWTKAVKPYFGGVRRLHRRGLEGLEGHLRGLQVVPDPRSVPGHQVPVDQGRQAGLRRSSAATSRRSGTPDQAGLLGARRLHQGQGGPRSARAST